MNIKGNSDGNAKNAVYQTRIFWERKRHVRKNKNESNRINRFNRIIRADKTDYCTQKPETSLDCRTAREIFHADMEVWDKIVASIKLLLCSHALQSITTV